MVSLVLQVHTTTLSTLIRPRAMLRNMHEVESWSDGISPIEQKIYS